MSNSVDFFETYFDFVESNTESPMIFHRWCAVSCIASILGRKVYFKHGHRRIYPNHYVLLIGGPATRKSSAIDISERLLRCAGYDMFAPTRTSKEKFLADLSEGYGKQNTGEHATKKRDAFTMLAEMEEPHNTGPKEVTICSGEFNTFIGLNNLEFAGILGDLWDNKETFEVRNRTVSSSYICQPTVNILGGNTQQNMANAFPPEVIGQGFMSRLLLINSEDAKKIAFPDDPDVNLQTLLVNHLAQISDMHGEITVTPDAKELLGLIYDAPSLLSDVRFTYYNGRRFTHLLKLCVVTAVARLSKEIEVHDVIYANSMLSYAELAMPKALGEFGKSKLADLNNKIMNILYDCPQGMNANELFKLVSNDADKLSQVVEVLQNLKLADKIMPIGLTGRYKAKPKGQIDNGMLDFSLLREYVEPPQPVAIHKPVAVK